MAAALCCVMRGDNGGAALDAAATAAAELGRSHQNPLVLPFFCEMLHFQPQQASNRARTAYVSEQKTQPRARLEGEWR